MKYYSPLPGETGRQVEGYGYGLRIASCDVGSANVDVNKQDSPYIKKKTQIHLASAMTSTCDENTLSTTNQRGRDSK